MPNRKKCGKLFPVRRGNIVDMRMWRNGRRSRLKICRFHDRVGSSPTIRIHKKRKSSDFGQRIFLFPKRRLDLNSPFKVYASLRSAQNKRPLDVCSAPHHPPTVQGLRGATVGAKRMVYISFRSVQSRRPLDVVHPPDIQHPTIRKARLYFPERMGS